MRTNNKVVVFVVMGFALVAVLAFFIYKNNSSSRFDWRETYDPASREPYGTSITAHLLENYFGRKSFSIGKKPLRTLLHPDDTTGITNLIFIGTNMYLTEQDADTLARFVSNGNNVFISARSIPYELANALSMEICYEDGRMTGIVTEPEVRMNLYHPSLESSNASRFRFQSKGEPADYSWGYFKVKNFCNGISNYDRLGYILPYHPNFIRFAWGNGFIYLHLDPLVFTNFEMLDETSVQYAEKVFSHLPEGKTCFDEFSGNPIPLKHGPKMNTGPLSFILSQKALRWAWYTLLVLIALYFIFRARRRQKIIPVILPNENTSLEFVQTVGALYYQQHDHQKLILQKMRLFLLFIRNRYYMQTNVIDNQLVKKISVKSQVPEAEVEKIFRMYNSLQNTVIQVNEDDLINFHKALDYFYRNCK